MKRLLLVALAACGGGHSAPVHPAPPPVQQPPAQVAVAEPGPSGPECEQLRDHAISLTHKQLTDDELAHVRLQLQQLMAECQAMPRATYRCAMAAGTMADLADCDQRTPSSSTSNSSVEPGGMTPPAPRSP
jgi:hypothetical protein